ncbi:nucleotide exchange factor GrpE [Robertkochia solimangrovi]|uniref:nucleotide exchange factor GrpE n=1 Tax=Robertkochia solimangrovi TaxID=2213046 RepID=UPI00117FCCB9|nr:nucleotide exchange factor GrpE [Robertkochia solimangrovi]TRZ43721.1 nucleotide exchange factor GrpE [Robertkochia solimangrovi]
MSKKAKEKDTAMTDENIETQGAPVQEDAATAKAENEQVQSETEVMQEELQKEKDKFLRLFAEFENYKKRTSKERMELYKTAGQDIMVSMLPVLDDFDRALAELAKNDEGDVLTGVELISNKLKDTLKNKGLAIVEVAQGDAFDAELHEAITQIPAPSEDLKGKIIDVIEKGYKLGDRIIRHPKVVVGQ